MEKKDAVLQLLLEQESVLNYSEEDKMQLKKLTITYFRKRTMVTNSNIQITAAAILWQYSKLNFLFENNGIWSQKNIAKLFDVRPKSVSSKSTEISKALKINYFDERFCRKEISDRNPFKKFAMTPSRFIVFQE